MRNHLADAARGIGAPSPRRVAEVKTTVNGMRRRPAWGIGLRGRTHGTRDGLQRARRLRIEQHRQPDAARLRRGQQPIGRRQVPNQRQGVAGDGAETGLATDAAAVAGIAEAKHRRPLRSHVQAPMRLDRIEDQAMRDAFAGRRPYRENKATGGTQQARHFGERALGVADRVQPEVHDDRIKAAIGKVQVLGIAGAEGNVGLAAPGDRQPALAVLAALLALTGDLEAARAAVSQILRAHPTASVAAMRASHPMRHLTSYFDKPVEGLRLAGLPET